MVNAIIEVAQLYGVQWQGYSISSLAQQPWETKVVFDDSILQDRQTNINEGVLLCGNGLMSRKTFLVKTLGMTDEEADLELQRIASERQMTGTTLDTLEMGGAE